MEKDKVIRPIELIVIGGSAGSLQVIMYLLENLDASFKIPILVVLHRDPQGSSRLTELLGSRTKIHVREIEDKDMLLPCCIYICPADYHVLFESDNSFSLDYSEKINFSRPSIDVSFKSAADIFGSKLLCILLSGANSDGAEGITYVKNCEGTVIVQDPVEAQVSYMPEQAILQKRADHIWRSEVIMQYLQALPK